MKKFLLILSVLAICAGQAKADRERLFWESFKNVGGNDEGTIPIDMSKLDNPTGWTFTNAYAGPQYLIIKEGGTVTVPSVDGITGNACIYFEAFPWAPTGKEPDFDHDNFASVSVNIGTLSTTKMEPGVSTMSGDIYIYDVTPESRVTLTAHCDLMIRLISVYYGDTSFSSGMANDLTGYSHEPGDYYKPFDLTLTKSSLSCDGNMTDDGSHNILVYTLDGSSPERTSTQYDGTPIRISSTTTVKSATILGNGGIRYDTPRTYTMTEAVDITPAIPEATYTVTLTQAGTLQDKLAALDADRIEGLVISGPINGADLGYLVSDKGMMGTLSYVDMADVTFVYDDAKYKTAVYAPEGGMGTVTTFNYYFSAENSEEYHSTSPTTAVVNIYSNNMAGAFDNHAKITRIVTPKVLTVIGSGAFAGKNLIMATLPDGVTEIGTGAFGTTTANINLPNSIVKIGDVALTGYMGAVNLPNLEYVGDAAFANSKLYEFTFNPKLTYIGKEAFAGTQLEEVNIPTPPDTIHESTFAYCEKLRTVTLGEGVRNIKRHAFLQVTYLGKCAMETINMPTSLEEIGYEAFPEPVIKAITPEDGIRYIGRVAVNAEQGLTSATIKEGTYSLSEQLFHWSNLESITLPSSLKIIGINAFSGSNLKTLPAMPGVVRICESAFASTPITSVSGLDGVEYIGDRAFEGCTSITKAELPESLKYLGGNVFAYCNALWRMDYNAIDCDVPYGVMFAAQNPNATNNLEKINIGPNVKRIPGGLFGCSKSAFKSVVLPQSVEKINPYAFYYNTVLTDVVLSDNITEIPEHAFYECSALKNVHWPLKLKTIGQGAFSNCKSLTMISLPEGTEKVEDGAFEYTSNVNTLYIASTIKEIASSAFLFDNANLESMTITSTALTPPAYSWIFGYTAPAVVKVPAAALDAYKNASNWNNAKFTITTIEQITAPDQKSETSFGSGLNQDSDLTDTVVGDVYVTVGDEDGYDESDGSIVLNSTMNDEHAEAIGTLAPGQSDLANRFNGIVVMVPAGNGTVSVDCKTIGARTLAVKVGENEAHTFVKSDKGTVDVEYNVVSETYVYIYGAEQTEPASAKAKAPATDNCVKIYGIGIDPTGAGVGDITTDNNATSPVTDWYTIDGKRLDSPTVPGLYIVRRADGSVQKTIVK